MATTAIIALQHMIDEDVEDEMLAQQRRRKRARDTAFIAAKATQSFEGEEKSRVKGYIEYVVPGYTDEDFRRMFRMNRATFSALIEHIKTLPEMQPLGHERRDPISIDKQLLLTLWYLGGSDPLRKIADLFGISESTAVMCRNRMISVLINMKNTVVRWPRQDEKQIEEQEFQRRNGFLGIIGAVD